MRVRFLIIFGLLACTHIHANILPDISWEDAKQVQHDSTVNQIWLTADRPGAGTGTEVLPCEVMMWETGFEVQHALHTHTLTLPTTLFRFGLPGPAELRLEYTGSMDVFDKQPLKPNYDPSPLTVGTKINIFENHGHNNNLRLVPRTSVLVNLNLPITPSMAKEMPIGGAVDLLFENELTDWLSLGYDIGARWEEWTPAPDIFAALGFNIELANKLGMYVEAFGTFDPDAVHEETSKTYTHSDVNLNFGFTYAVHPRVQLDVYAGFNCYNSDPQFSNPQNKSFVGFGVAWMIWHNKRNVVME